MDKVEVKVDVKNRFLAFEQEGDDDVAGELLDKFNQKREEKALKKAIKTAAKEKSQPKKQDIIEVSPKNGKSGSTVEGDTGLQIDERKKKKKKKRVESASEVVVDERPRERVVYQGGKEFTKKTHSTFAAKMLATAREAKQNAKNDRHSEVREGFNRDRERFVKPAYEANFAATDEVSSGQFGEMPRYDRSYRGRGGYRQGRVGFNDQVQQDSSTGDAAIAGEASSSHVEENPRNSRPYRGRGGFSQGRDGFSDQTQVPSSENPAAVIEETSSSQFEQRSRNGRPYRGRGGFSQGRDGFSDQTQVPFSENPAAVGEEASSSQFGQRSRNGRPYRGVGGYRGDRVGFDRQTSEPEVKQYTLDEWKQMQAEMRKKSSLNVAKTKEGAKGNETKEKVTVEKVEKQEYSKTGIQIKFGTASYHGRRGRGRGGMDRRGDERDAPRMFAEAPNVSDDTAFPRLK